MTPLQLRLIFFGIVMIAAFTAGWQTKGAFVAKDQLAIEKAKDEFPELDMAINNPKKHS